MNPSFIVFMAHSFPSSVRQNEDAIFHQVNTNNYVNDVKFYHIKLLFERRRETQIPMVLRAYVSMISHLVTEDRGCPYCSSCLGQHDLSSTRLLKTELEQGPSPLTRQSSVQPQRLSLH